MLAAKPSKSPKQTIINTTTEMYKARDEHIMWINALNACLWGLVIPSDRGSSPCLEHAGRV